MSAEFGLVILLISFPVYLLYTGKFNKYMGFVRSNSNSGSNTPLATNSSILGTSSLTNSILTGMAAGG